MLASIPTAVTEAEGAMLSELAAGRTVLEMGAHLGYSTIVLAKQALRVHSVDWHRGDAMVGSASSLVPYLTNIDGLTHGNVVSHIGRFEEVLPLFRDAAFDGVFIDGCHDFTSVCRDSQLAARLVCAGGWLAWHDFGRFDVARAVAAWLGVESPALHVHRVDYLAWVIR